MAVPFSEVLASAGYPSATHFGTKDKPVYFSGGAINQWIVDFTKANKGQPMEVIINLMGDPEQETVFWVGPDYNKSGQYIQGSTCLYLNPVFNDPKADVTIRILGNSMENCILRTTGRHYTDADCAKWTNNIEDAVIRSATAGYATHIEIKDLTVDANWKAQGLPTRKGSKTRGFRLHGIQIRALTHDIQRVKVINTGSKNDMVGKSDALECFPLNTYALNTPENSYSTISDCIVRDFNSVDGGYATLISVNNFTDKQDHGIEYYGPEREDHVPSYQSIVFNCKIQGLPNTNGFGASGTIASDGAYASHRILFHHNHVDGCGIGSNFDTSGIRYIGIEDNLFTNVNTMAQLGTPTGSMKDGKPNPLDPTFHYNFIIRGNKAILCRHYVPLSPDHPDSVFCAGLIIRNNSAGIIYQDNVLIVDDVDFHRGEWPDTMSDIGTLRLICRSDVQAYFDEYYGTSGSKVTCCDDLKDGRCSGNMIIGASMVGTDCELSMGMNTPLATLLSQRSTVITK